MLPDRTEISSSIIVNGWTLRFTSLAGDEQERFDPLLKLIHLDHHDRVWAAAHAMAHVDLGHIGCAPHPFTAQEERDATALASLRLDLQDNDEWDLEDFPADGEPTQRM